MIAVTSEKGIALRKFNPNLGSSIGWYPQLGFMSDTAVQDRNVVRKRGGKSEDLSSPWFQFEFKNGNPVAINGCEIHSVSERKWQLSSKNQKFFIVPAESAVAFEIPDKAALSPSGSLDWALGLLMLLILALGAWSALRQPESNVKVVEDKQKTVVVQVAKAIPPPPKEKPAAPEVVQPKKVGAAVQQKLGFLALLGKKELTKAMGGLPTNAERRSPGAGAGGSQGSGGELLAGLGQGVKHTTVGNSGVAGLGGIGNAGAGGGEGGFGTSYIGSGGSGKSLSDVRLGKDIELEGGLDQAVVRATIAKYLSQIRACYERGLRSKPHLAGQVSMDFEIGASGKLNFAKVKNSSLDFPETENCISQAMLTWQFPKPVGGTLVKVNYPFTLKPSNYM